MIIIERENIGQNIKWLREWSLAFAIIIGAVASIFVG